MFALPLRKKEATSCFGSIDLGVPRPNEQLAIARVAAAAAAASLAIDLVAAHCPRPVSTVPSGTRLLMMRALPVRRPHV
jgi:hypothetical protein